MLEFAPGSATNAPPAKLMSDVAPVAPKERSELITRRPATTFTPFVKLLTPKSWTSPKAEAPELTTIWPEPAIEEPTLSTDPAKAFKPPTAAASDIERDDDSAVTPGEMSVSEPPASLTLEYAPVLEMPSDWSPVMRSSPPEIRVSPE